jgi:haloalkane dehalogenase
MMITRHYLTLKGPKSTRRVHYRKAGSGPPLLMIHQSPRSSAEYEALMRDWGKYFTCIAPDTPGFGQSDPLDNPAPEIDDFADAIVEFADAVGIKKIAGYGFHSGGIILITAMKRHMEKFSTLAIGGYAIWNAEERKNLGVPYIPPCVPLPYGEHLTWLWNRILEQSWYFPWFAPNDATRLPNANDDPVRAHPIILEMLDSGDAYRLGYGAVLRGPRDIPPLDSATPPVLITAYTGDPLKVHLERLGELPLGWQSFGVETPGEHQDASLAYFKAHASKDFAQLAEDGHQGFLHIKTSDYDGLIHWRGPAAATRMVIHGPGREAELLGDTGAMRIDLPGHGLSNAWPGVAPDAMGPWQEVIDAVAAHFGIETVEHEPLPRGDPSALYHDLTPDRFGNYLTTAWSIVRAQHIYAPWYQASASTAIPIDAAKLEPANLAKEHRALIRATAAKELHLARRSRGEF